MRELIMVMLDLVIMFLTSVQANDMTSSSSHSNSLPNLLHPFCICFEKRIEEFKNMKGVHPFEQQSCELNTVSIVSKSWRENPLV